MKGLVQTVLSHAEARPQGVGVRVCSRRNVPHTLTWGEIAAGATRAAAGLAARGVTRGDVVALIGTHHPDLYATWLGAVWLGAIPSILAEPTVRVAPEIYWQRLHALFDRIRPRLIAADPRLTVRLQEATSAPMAPYDELANTDGAPPRPLEPNDHDLLLLQHSSGTTGLHKGVMLSHGAVRRHAASYAQAISLTDSDVIATWLPLYHDMGLIACFVCPLLWGAQVVWASPFEWVANPRLLLDVVSEHRATLAWLPNFAYSFIAQRVREVPPALDLASLRMVINCSEPVTAHSMEAFRERFAPAGFRGEALHTCYAMAENVFAVSGTRSDAPPRTIRVHRHRWQAEHVAEPTESNDQGALKLVSSGPVVPGVEVRVVDDEGAVLPPRHAGRLTVRSPFLFDGYYLREDLNAHLFEADGFFDTGDLGFIDETGHVFVTGRKKDLVIVGGRNVYPQDVEDAVSHIEGVYPGRAVCFGVWQHGLDTEGLVVLVEPAVEEAEWSALAHRVRRSVPERLDLDLADVRVVARGTLRKSSSGKLARAGNREWYLDGRFGPPPAGVQKEEE